MVSFKSVHTDDSQSAAQSVSHCEASDLLVEMVIELEGVTVLLVSSRFSSFWRWVTERPNVLTWCFSEYSSAVSMAS